MATSAFPIRNAFDAMDDQRQCVHRLARDQHVELHEVTGPVADVRVVEAGVARRAALQQVVEVHDQLGQRQLEMEVDAPRIEVLHRAELAAAAGGELHDRADVVGGGDDLGRHPGLADRLDLAGGRHLGRVVDDDLARAVQARDPVLDAWRGGDELQVELALEALLDDLHVEQAQEAAPEAEAERHARLRLVDEARVVEVEPLERVAQERVLVAAQRIDPGEHEWQGLLVAGQGNRRRVVGIGQGVTHPGIGDALQARGHVPDLAGGQAAGRDRLRPEIAELEDLALGGRWP